MEHKMTPRPERFPLSQSQLGVLLESLRYPDSSQGMLDYLIDLPSDTDDDRLAAAIEQAVESHDSLFLRFGSDGGEFYQYVDRSVPFGITRCTMQEEEVDGYIHSHLYHINMLGDALFAARLIRTPKALHLVINVSHAIMDGASAYALANECVQRYMGTYTRTEDVPLRRAVESELREIGSQAYLSAKEYCRRTFAGLPVAMFPERHPDDLGPMKRIFARIERSSFDRLEQASGVKANRVFMTALALVLRSCSGEDKVVFDALYHGRDEDFKRKTCGMLVRNVPVLADFSRAKTSLRDISAGFDENFAGNPHGIYPYMHFCNDLAMATRCTYSFVSGRSFVECDGRQIPVEQYLAGEYADDTSLLIYENRDYYDVCVEYNSARCDAQAARRLLQMIVTVAGNIAKAGADAPLSRIPLVPSQEQDKLLTLGSGCELPRETRLLHELIDERAEVCPDAVAVADCESRMTYAELKEKSDALALWLHASGVRRGECVALQMPRRKEFVVAALGAMKAGATYVPMDMNYPADRISYMMENSGAAVVLTQESVSSVTSSVTYSSVASTKPAGKTCGEDIAYIIYTSGSMGHPKGVRVSHRALTSFCRTCVHTYELTSSDRIMCQGTFSFDASVEDLFPVLTVGGELHILEEDKVADLDAIASYIKEHAISGCNFTTQLGQLLLSMHPSLPLRYMTVGGEKLNALPTHRKCRFFNSYGPTEFTVDATFWEAGVDAGDLREIPIGRPVCDAQAYVLDKDMRLLPRGFNGELYLAGTQTASGYQSMREETERRFVRNPYSQKYPVMYATGDLAHWGEDGNLYFAGRRDGQVKLRGFRIETEEVSACLMRCEGVRAAQTAVRMVAGHEMLCSWYVTDGRAEEEALRSFLKDSLPHFMVPDTLIPVASFPTLASGKVDVNALPLPETKVHDHPQHEPGTRREKLLWHLASRILGREDFDVTDGLRSEGMTSMLSMQFCAEAKRNHILVKVSDVMSDKSIRELSAGASTVVSWYKPYEKGKPVLVLVSGVLATHFNLPRMEYMSRELNILFVEPLDEHYGLIFREKGTYESVVSLYYSLVDAYLPEGERIAAFMGFSIGGNFAYSMARLYHEATGVMAKVVIGDSMVMYDENPELTDDEYEERLGEITQMLAELFYESNRPEFRDEESYMEFVRNEAEVGTLRTIYADRVCYGREMLPLGCDVLLLNTTKGKPADFLPGKWGERVRSIEVLDVDRTHNQMCCDLEGECLALLCDRVMAFAGK